MSYDSQSSRSNQPDMFGELVFKLAVAIITVPVVPALVVGWIVSHRVLLRSTHPRRDWLIVGALTLIGLALGYHFFWPLTTPKNPVMVLGVDFFRSLHTLSWNGGRLVRELLPVWGMNLVVAPLAVCLCALFAEPRSVAQLVTAQRQQRLAATRQAAKVAERVLSRKKIPDAVTVGDKLYGVLGIPIEGTLNWIFKGLFCLPIEFMVRHIVVVGCSGSGKSETLLRIAVFAAKTLGWQVIYVDAKGDYEMAVKFRLAMEQAGIRNVKMFPEESYNGWIGTRDALLSRLLAIENVAEVTNEGQHHYKTIADNLLEMAINAPGGPPTSSEDLLDRLLITNGRLLDLYEGYAEQQEFLKNLNKQEVLSAYGRYRAFFRKLRGKLDGAWSYDDVQAAYILLDGLAHPEIADGLGRYLIADFVNYSTRKPRRKRTLYIFDEVGALNVPLANVYEKVRFRGVSVAVSSQDPSGLAHRHGAWQEVKQVLGNAAIKIVHKCEDAEEVIRRAGTVEVVETDYRFSDRGATGGGTARTRRELKIDPNEVMRLRDGEAFVVSSGEYERVRVAMHQGQLDEARIAELADELERRVKAEPPPPPRRHGAATIVDSTLASPSAPRSTAQPGGNVDETSPDHREAASTQPGVLPMWQINKDEDLLK